MKPNDSPLVRRSMVSKENTMLSSIESRKAFNPNSRGYHAVYHDGEINHCPGCGRTHWLIGRVSAECAFCSTALALAEASTQKGPVIIQHKNRDAPHAWAA